MRKRRRKDGGVEHLPTSIRSIDAYLDAVSSYLQGIARRHTEPSPIFVYMASDLACPSAYVTASTRALNFARSPLGISTINSSVRRQRRREG